MVRVMVVVVGLMVLLVFTPAIRPVLRLVLRDRVHLMDRSIQALRVLCVWPIAMTFRNYFHGHLLMWKRTLGMAVGGVARTSAVALAAWVMHRAELLDHTWGAAILVLGVASEAIVAALFVRWMRVPRPGLRER